MFWKFLWNQWFLSPLSRKVCKEGGRDREREVKERGREVKEGSEKTIGRGKELTLNAVGIALEVNT